MLYTIAEIADIVRPIAERYGIPAVYLFGSYARGTATEQSDIDLLIDTTGTDLTTLFGIGAVYADLEDALGKPIDLITMGSLKQTAQMPSEKAFRENIMRERVNLYGAA